MGVLRTFGCLALLVLLVSACGGGGGGGGSGNGGGGGGTPGPGGPEVLTGRFIDSPVSGLPYSTPTRSGVTNTDGEFEYLAGESVSFFIGDIVLGSSPGGAVITPLDLVAGASDVDHPHVVNIVRLLQTLDEDGNPDNGIRILASVVEAASGVVIDVFVETAVFESDGVLTVFLANNSPANTDLIDTADALMHFQQSLAALAETEIYFVKFTLKGLQGGETLQFTNNGRDLISVSSDGVYSFLLGVNAVDGYDVDLVDQPPGQFCIVINDEADSISSDIANVTAYCDDEAYQIGVNVSGIEGDVSSRPLRLANNSDFADDLNLELDGTAYFSQLNPRLAGHNVRIINFPYRHDCDITGSPQRPIVYQPSGIVSDIDVACRLKPYTLTARVTGLDNGQVLELTNNGDDVLSIDGSGDFGFSQTLLEDETYDVSLSQPPADQICRFQSSTSGTVRYLPEEDVVVLDIICGTETVESYNFIECSSPLPRSFTCSPGHFEACVLGHYSADSLIDEITELDCANGAIDDVRDAAFFPNLRSLDLSNNPLRQATLDWFQQYNGQLEYLDVSPNERLPIAQIILEVSNLRDDDVNSFIGELDVYDGFTRITNDSDYNIDIYEDGSLATADALYIVIEGLLWGTRTRLRFDRFGFLDSSFFAQNCRWSNASGNEIDLGTVTPGSETPVINLDMECESLSVDVGVAVSGLQGEVSVSSGAETLVFNASETRFFPTPVDVTVTSTVDIQVDQQPSEQTCRFDNALTQINTPVSPTYFSRIVNLSCNDNLVDIGGTVSGLNGQLVLQNNGGDDLLIDQNGPFSFQTPADQTLGESYSVSIQDAPEDQICTLENATGTPFETVSDIEVVCTPQTVDIGGIVDGLDVTLGSLTLQLNGGSDLVLDSDGPFSIPLNMDSGGSYEISIVSNPSAGYCSVTDGNGVTVADIDTVSITCYPGFVEIESPPSSTQGFASEVYDSRIYVSGGGSFGSNNVRFYDTEPGAGWVSAPPMLESRSDHSLTAHDFKLFAIGGSSGNVPTNSVEYFDGSNWISAPPLSGNRSNHSSVSLDGKIYVIGGQSDSPGFNPLNTMEIFDSSTNSWSPGAEMSVSRRLHSSVVLDGKIYVIGGSGSSGTTEIYDPETDQWEPGPPLNSPRWDHSSGVFNGEIYTAGGRVSNFVSNLSIEVMDPIGGWIELQAELPESMVEHRMHQLDQRLFMIDAQGRSFTYDPTFDFFNPMTPPRHFVSQHNQVLPPDVQSRFDLRLSMFARAGIINPNFSVSLDLELREGESESLDIEANRPGGGALYLHEGVTSGISGSYPDELEPAGLFSFNNAYGGFKFDDWNLLINDTVINGSPELFLRSWGVSGAEYHQSNPELTIPDNDFTGMTDSILVADTELTVSDRFQVVIDVSHTYPSDLNIELESPSGMVIVLWARQDSGVDGVRAVYPYSQAPVSGDFADLIGESFDGEWRLRIRDEASIDEGTLRAWALRN